MVVRTLPHPLNAAWLRSIWIVPAAYLLVALATFWQYGITWDEPVQSRYGQLALHYYASFGHDRSVDQFLNLRFYGPLFEMIPAAIAHFLPAWTYEIRHLCIVLAAAMAVAGAGRTCTLLG